MINRTKTKIICTIGPSSDSEQMILDLAKEGMNIVRFNFSHDTHENHLRRMNMVRKVSEESGYNLAILLDTKGPEIRCGEMENGSVDFAFGDRVTLLWDPNLIGNHERFSVSSREMLDDVSIGDSILIDDGKIRLSVLEKQIDSVICRIENPGSIKTRKGINVPNVILSMPFISDKDDADIRFGCQNDVDFIAASFVRRAQDIIDIRKILEEEGKTKIRIIAKIENQEGVDNIKSILDVADGVMVARGDLGVEVSFELVPIYQKKIIHEANRLGKPVVTATHMLESMMNYPRPTRAEASDVANAILDGTDCIMLSGESAAGKYPIDAVRTMKTIARSIEPIIPYRDSLEKAVRSSQRTVQDSIGISVADSALNLDDVEAIIAFTQSGATAQRISKYRPKVPVLAVTFNQSVQRKLEANWGVFPVYSDIQNNMYNDDELASIVARNYGIQPGKLVIITAGYPQGLGTTNMMKIVRVR